MGLGAISTNLESSSRIKEFVAVARYTMMARGEPHLAMTMAEGQHAGDRIVETLKAAVAAGSTVGPWGAELAKFNLSASFLNGLTSVSVFDTLRLGGMNMVPLRSTVVMVTQVLTGSTIAQASAKTIQRLSVGAADLDGRKAVCIVALTEELLRFGGPRASELLERALRAGLVRATDAAFIPTLTAGIASFLSSGSNAAAVTQDLRTLLQTIQVGADSRLYLIVPWAVAKAWSLMSNSTGARAFPDLNWNGGTIAGIRVLPTESANSGEVLLIDASQVAAGDEGVQFDQTGQATLQLDSSPDSPISASTPMTSLWQMDMSALRIERWFDSKLLRSSAAAKVTGAVYVGNSPA